MKVQRVSVVITTYFRDSMLAECLESLAAQTLPLHEVVVVDDGGSGSARAVVEQFGPSFRYQWQPNGGMQSARNHGARASTGDWIAFLDDDDLWLPMRHSLVTELISTGQVDLISGDFNMFGDGGVSPTGVFDLIAKLSPSFWDGIPHEPGARYSVVGHFPTPRMFPHYPFWPSTLVIQRDLFDRLNGWNENVRGMKSEDIEFSFRALKIAQLGLIWIPTVHYRSHAENDSNNMLENAFGRINIWEILLTNQSASKIEKSALINSIHQTAHEVIWEAFSKKDYQSVIKASRKINLLNLNSAEKIKVAISRIILSISAFK